MKALVWVQKVRTGAGENLVLEGSFGESAILAEEGEGPALGPESPRMS